jgi:hypothetical protein
MGGMIEVPDEVLASFTGELIGPEDAGYEQARRVHNGLIDKRPALIARCRTVPDIVDAVAIGREQGTETLRPYMTDRSYVNNLTTEDGQKVHEVWGANYRRLVTVKRRYDPDNVFRLNHNIDPLA